MTNYTFNYPKVSVIIPTFGGSKSLFACVKSVLKDSYSNFDVIVVDDNNPCTKGRKKPKK
mgnify:FL=1